MSNDAYRERVQTVRRETQSFLQQIREERLRRRAELADTLGIQLAAADPAPQHVPSAPAVDVEPVDYPSSFPSEFSADPAPDAGAADVADFDHDTVRDLDAEAEVHVEAFDEAASDEHVEVLDASQSDEFSADGPTLLDEAAEQGGDDFEVAEPEAEELSVASEDFTQEGDHAGDQETNTDALQDESLGAVSEPDDDLSHEADLVSEEPSSDLRTLVEKSAKYSKISQEYAEADANDVDEDQAILDDLTHSAMKAEEDVADELAKLGSELDDESDLEVLKSLSKISVDDITGASSLTCVPTLGSGLVKRLEDLGYTSLADLASADPAEIARGLGPLGRLLRPDLWVAFAQGVVDEPEDIDQAV